MNPVDPTPEPLLSVDDLRTSFDTPAGAVQAVDGASLILRDGEVVGLVGESGSGKSTMALAIMGLVDPPGQVSGSVRLGDRELIGATDAEMDQVRGAQIAMVFQQANASLDPVMSIGRQLSEALPRGMSRSDRNKRAVELLDLVGIADPAHRVKTHAHELSGGMAQRVMIAIALAGDPDVLIADEPTSSLDVTIQAQIVDLLDELRTQRGLAVLFISHDLDLVASMADRILVMYGGQIVEDGATAEVLDQPSHPYTSALLRSNPSSDLPAGRLVTLPVDARESLDESPGCKFAPRCPIRPDDESAPCLQREPERTPVGDTHGVRCWLNG